MGDPARVIVCNAIITEILQKGLVQQAAQVGEELYNRIQRLSEKFPQQIQNLRGKGRGLCIAFDTTNAAAVVSRMRSLRVNIGMCGSRTVRL
jgi:4-aminobutyrate aminotransferase/(S)-3-amino-2-methylpropionate transaminase